MYLINTEQREHLKLLRENGKEVAIEICKLALDYMTNGSNNSNRFQTFACKINTTPSALTETINALIMLQCKSVQTNVSEEEFALIEQIGFEKDVCNILWQFVSSSIKQKHFVLAVLDQISITDYRFVDLEWRLESRTSSRSLMHQCVPLITLKFHLDSEKVNENKSPLYLIGDSQQQHSRKKEVIFQTDPNNLLYIINVLEKTLQEARTHRVRNIVKNL